MRLLKLLGVIGSLCFLLACNSTKREYFSKKDVRHAQKLMGLEFQKPYLDTLYPYLLRNRAGYDTLRKFSLDYQQFPALLFNPQPRDFTINPEVRGTHFHELDAIVVPENKEEIAFFTVAQLHTLLKTRQITSLELTELYLDRLKKHDKTLSCVISLTEKLAIEQAQRADRLIGEGIFLSRLHGIPYGLKDLVAVEGYPTTWGAYPYKDQVLDHTASVAKRLEAAGAVLVAKLTSGALARGDVWFGGKTKNPWDISQGASGSSAGSGAATAAGLVGFSIGTETLGSITGPSTRNGITGLRPSYGRVSRNGVMSLSWSMDKVGPMCRSAEGCAMVFEVIEGSDGLDQTVVDAPFNFNFDRSLDGYKVGYLQEIIEKDSSERGENLKAALQVMEEAGVDLIPISLPKAYPFAAYDIILRAEAGAFFEELVREGGVNSMVEQNQRSRANSLRQSRFIPAVEYLQANRYRAQMIEEVHGIMKDLDVLISPTFGGSQLMMTNLTGHPVVCLPTGLDEENHPTSMSLVGNLYEEGSILEFAYLFQQITDFDELYPPDYVPSK